MPMFNDELTVDIKKDELLAILRENRAKHREIFEKAVDRYHALALTMLTEYADKLKHNPHDPVQVRMTLPLPEDHTADYDRVIGMIEKHTGDVIVITEGKYANYVEDEWSWSRAWAGNTQTYLAS